MSNPFDLGRLVYHRVHGNLLTRFFASSLRLTKIQTSRQLSDAEDFEAAFDDIATQRRSGSQFRQTNGRSQIGKEIEMFPQRQKGRALRLLVGRKTFPFRTSDRS